MNSILYIYILLLVFSCKEPTLKKISDESSYEEVSSFRKLSAEEKIAYKQRLAKMYDSLLVRRAFNGGIIIAKNGEVLLEDYRGYADFSTKDTITPNTPFHPASISKTFTGMAVLKLA